MFFHSRKVYTVLGFLIGNCWWYLVFEANSGRSFFNNWQLLLRFRRVTRRRNPGPSFRTRRHHFGPSNPGEIQIITLFFSLGADALCAHVPYVRAQGGKVVLVLERGRKDQVGVVGAERTARTPLRLELGRETRRERVPLRNWPARPVEHWRPLLAPRPLD